MGKLISRDELDHLSGGTQLPGIDKELATELHEILCRYNHTDGCGWYYDDSNPQWEDEHSSHGTWLRMARRIIKENPTLDYYAIIRLAIIFKDA